MLRPLCHRGLDGSCTRVWSQIQATDSGCADLGDVLAEGNWATKSFLKGAVCEMKAKNDDELNMFHIGHLVSVASITRATLISGVSAGPAFTIINWDLETLELNYCRCSCEHRQTYLYETSTCLPLPYDLAVQNQNKSFSGPITVQAAQRPVSTEQISQQQLVQVFYSLHSGND